MNHFTIFAHGEGFDVDALLKVTKLVFSKVWHRGDPRVVMDAAISTKHETSGVEIEIGDGNLLSIDDQDSIAADFLAAHANELQELGKFLGVEAFIVGLHCVHEFDSNTVGFCEGPSRRLMWHVLNVGAELTFYFTLKRQFDN